jgi:hypothetical protein
VDVRAAFAHDGVIHADDHRRAGRQVFEQRFQRSVKQYGLVCPDAAASCGHHSGSKLHAVHGGAGGKLGGAAGDLEVVRLGGNEPAFK